MNKIIEEEWTDFYGNDTTALSIQKDGLLTISELIELLEEAKNKYGDKEMLFHDFNHNCMFGFSHVYLSRGYDEREQYGDDCYENEKICIYG